MNLMSQAYLKCIEPRYDFIVIDELQDFTQIQLTLLLKALKMGGPIYVMRGFNQIVHPNFFSWSKIKTLFYNGLFRCNNR